MMMKDKREHFWFLPFSAFDRNSFLSTVTGDWFLAIFLRVLLLAKALTNAGEIEDNAKRIETKYAFDIFMIALYEKSNIQVV